FFLSMLPPPPDATLFPYTTLFRSYRTASGRERDKDSTREGDVFGIVFQLRRRRILHSYLARYSSLFCNGPDTHTAHTVVLTESADRKSTRLNSSHLVNSYAVFRLK